MTQDALDAFFAERPATLKVGEVAQIMRLSRQGVNQMLRQGRLPGYQHRSSWIVVRDELKQVLRGTSPAEANASGAFDEVFEAYPETLQVSEVSQILRLGSQAVREALREKRLPGYSVASNWIIVRDEFKEVLRAGSNQLEKNDTTPEE